MSLRSFVTGRQCILTRLVLRALNSKSANEIDTKPSKKVHFAQLPAGKRMPEDVETSDTALMPPPPKTPQEKKKQSKDEQKKQSGEPPVDFKNHGKYSRKEEEESKKKPSKM